MTKIIINIFLIFRSTVIETKILVCGIQTVTLNYFAHSFGKQKYHRNYN